MVDPFLLILAVYLYTPARSRLFFPEEPDDDDTAARMNAKKSRKTEFANDRPYANQSAHVDRGLVFSSLAPFALILVLACGKSHLTLISILVHYQVADPIVTENIALQPVTLTTNYEPLASKVGGKIFCILLPGKGSWLVFLSVAKRWEEICFLTFFCFFLK